MDSIIIINYYNRHKRNSVFVCGPGISSHVSWLAITIMINFEGHIFLLELNPRC